jgi:hypothetical protein
MHISAQKHVAQCSALLLAYFGVRTLHQAWLQPPDVSSGEELEEAEHTGKHRQVTSTELLLGWLEPSSRTSCVLCPSCKSYWRNVLVLQCQP